MHVNRRDFLTASGWVLAAIGSTDGKILSLTTNPAATSDFYGDPYSALTTWYVDAATGVDPANPGTDRKPAGWVYRNYYAALRDAFYVGNPGARRIVVRAGTYTPPAGGVGYFPSGGPDAAHPCVIQGDPASATAPIITSGGGVAGSMFCIGNGGYNVGPYPGSNIVIRKIEMYDFVADCIYFYWGTVSNVIIECCAFHKGRYPPSNPSGVCGIGFSSMNTATHVTVRSCKFWDIGPRVGETLPAGPNCSPIETYGCDHLTIDNNYFEGAHAAVFTKMFDPVIAPPGGTCNNWKVRNNIFARCYVGFLEATNGNVAPGMDNIEMTGNLFYGPPLAVVGGASTMGTGTMGHRNKVGTGGLFANNTFAEDMGGGIAWQGQSGMVVRDNVFLDSRHIMTYNGTDSANTPSDPVVFSQFDYNAYGVGMNWQLGWGSQAYAPNYRYSSFAQWQVAKSVPRNNSGIGVSTPPPELVNIANPDVHGVWISNVPATFPNMASRNYKIAAGSPLLTASSTGGRVGYDQTNCGPGW